MLLGACGCPCGEAPIPSPREDAVAAPRDPLKEMAERATNRIVKFFFRGLLILLWVHLFNSMKRHAISYIGGDTWFSMFVVIVVAVPIAEIFCIAGHTITAISSQKPSASFACGCACGAVAGGEALREEELDAPLLDLEEGPNRSQTTPADDATAKTGTTDGERALERAAWKIVKCIMRGLMALLWVFLVDFFQEISDNPH